MKGIMNTIGAMYGQDFLEKWGSVIEFFYRLRYYVSVQVVDNRVRITCWTRPDSPYLDIATINISWLRAQFLGVSTRICNGVWDANFDPASDMTFFEHCFDGFDFYMSFNEC